MKSRMPRLTPLGWTNILPTGSLRHWGDGMVNRSIGEDSTQFSDRSHEGDVLAPLEKLA